MPSDLQVSNIKDLTGSNTGLSIASDGQVTISQNNPTVTLGSNTRLPQGAIANVHCSTPSSISDQTFGNGYTTTLTGSSVSYTPATGARYVVYQYVYAVNNVENNRGIYGLQFRLDNQKMTVSDIVGGGDYDGTASTFSTGGKSVLVSIDLSAITSNFSGHSSGHNWQTNAGGTSAFSAGTLSVVGARHSSSFDVRLHRIQNSGDGDNDANSFIVPTTIIYSVM